MKDLFQIEDLQDLPSAIEKVMFSDNDDSQL